MKRKRYIDLNAGQYVDCASWPPTNFLADSCWPVDWPHSKERSGRLTEQANGTGQRNNCECTPAHAVANVSGYPTIHCVAVTRSQRQLSSGVSTGYSRLERSTGKLNCKLQSATLSCNSLRGPNGVRSSTSARARMQTHRLLDDERAKTGNFQTMTSVRRAVRVLRPKCRYFFNAFNGFTLSFTLFWYFIRWPLATDPTRLKQFVSRIFPARAQHEATSLRPLSPNFLHFLLE